MANDKQQESVSQADGTAEKDPKGETQANPTSGPENVKMSPESVKGNSENAKTNAGNGKLNLTGANPSSQSSPTAAKPDASQPGTAQPVAKEEPRGVQVVRDDSRAGAAKSNPPAPTESTEGGRVTQALDGSKGASTMDSAGEVGSATGQGTLEVNETEVKATQPPVQSDKNADKVEEKEEKKDEAA